MGCVASKKAVSVTPAVDSSGVLRDHHHSVDSRQDDDAGSEAAILASSLRYRGGRAHQEKEGGEDEEVGGASGGDAVGSEASGKCGANDVSSRNSRMRNLHKYIEGEQAAAGWPSWLSAVAGEAIQGWVPLKADSFEKLEKIGQGTYSSVFRARDLESGKIVALKKVRFDNFEPESVRFMAREIQILRKLDHPNVMKLEGLITSRLSCSLYLVFEYMEHDLAGLSSSPDIKLSEPQIKCYTQQLLSGLKHCHSRGIIHRDIKGANLLVNNQGILKIADFGLANFFNLRHKQPLTSRVVTLWYRPPELLLGSTDYEASVDLWSVGCVFAEMFSGRPILQGRTEVEQLHKIFKLCGSPPDEYWKKSKLHHATLFKPHRPYESCLLDTFRKLPTNAVSLLQTFLSVEPYKRCTASTALASEYFRTKPYACEPSTLPKYPPCKEIDAKAREEAQRRKIAGRLRGAAGAKRQLGEQRALGEPIVTHKVADVKEDSQNVNGVGKNDAKQGVAKVNGEARLFVDLQPMPTIRPRESHHVKHDSREGIAFSGPLHVPASSGFAWAKRQREENAYGRSQVKPSSRNHFSGAVDAPNGLPTKIINSKREENGDVNSKGQENGDDKDIHGDSKAHESYELTKHAIMKKWSRLQRPDSFDSEMYNSQDLSQVFNGDPASRRHKISGYRDQGDRVEFSGPLLSQSHKVDELLQKHERHIRQAVRRSWFQKVAGRKQGN